MLLRRIHMALGLTLVVAACAGTAPEASDAPPRSTEPANAPPAEPAVPPEVAVSAPAQPEAPAAPETPAVTPESTTMPMTALQMPPPPQPAAAGSGPAPETRALNPQTTMQPSAAGAPAPADAPDACEVRHVFRAHGAAMAGDSSKYRIAAGAQLAASFYFKAPWDEALQLLRVHGMVDNAKIVHHWTLSAIHGKPIADGEIRAATGVRSEGVGDETPLGSGGPGATELALPADVGLRMPAGADVTFELEVHYVNVAGQADEMDASGVEVCLSRTKRPQEAAVHTLGRQTFSVPAHVRTDISSTCVPESQTGPVHMLAVTPHMHLTGVHSKVVINRKSGETQVLLDRGYVFQEQATHLIPEDRSSETAVLNPGDTITSVCTYENETNATIQSGDKVENEMCEMAIVAWPAGALHNTASSLIGALPGNEGIADLLCMDL